MANHAAPPPEWLNASYMQEALRKGLQQPALKVTRVEVSAGSAIGDNYAGQVFRIASHLSNGKKISTIGKTKPKTKMIEQMDDILDIFEVEALFFESALGPLSDITDIYNVIPVSYGVDFERKMILMEDLREKGFVLQQRGVFLNKDQAKLTVEALGKLHGASYLLLQQDSSFKKMFEKSLWSGAKDDISSKFIENGVRSLNKWVDSYNLPGDLAQKLKIVENTLERDWLKVCDYQEGKFNILCHGDAWKNNMMFHKTGEKFDEVRLLDFQIVSYNSFANDLQYFLFSSVDSDAILENLDYFLECYYEKVVETAPGIPDLTLERIRAEFSERYFFGLLMTTIFRPFVGATEPHDTENIVNGGSEDNGFENPVYRSDLLKLLPFFEKLGVLQ